MVGGRYFDFVPGYHLKYSDDAKHWRPYKERDATSWKVGIMFILIVLLLYSHP